MSRVPFATRTRARRKRKESLISSSGCYERSRFDESGSADVRENNHDKPERAASQLRDLA